MHLKEISRVTVIGIGVMGPDISLGFGLAGYEVTGVDIKASALEAAYKKLEDNLKQMVEGELISRFQAEKTKSRIHFTLAWETAAASADFITEAVPEVMETKLDVFRKCGDLCGPEVVVASNTSSMSISEIASGMRYPERAITTHWTIPAHLSPMVEVIRGERTSIETEELTLTLLGKIGKRPICCKDTPGFIHNYVQFALVKAALDLFNRGIATAEDIDDVVRNGFGLRISSVGPFQFIDMCGLDTILKIQEYMYEKTSDPMYQPSQAIQEKVSKGILGVKSGNGFYRYNQGKSEEFWQATNRNIIRVLKALKA